MKTLRTLTLVVCLAAAPCAFGALTTVQDTIVNATGGTCSGSMSFTGPTFTSVAGALVGGSTFTRLVTAGAVNVTLEPGSYTVRYLLTPCVIKAELWVVPVSGSTVNLATVRALNLPPLPALIPLSYLSRSGATTGQFAQWNGTTWVPATVTGGGGTPGGVSGDVQLNNASAFGPAPLSKNADGSLNASKALTGAPPSTTTYVPSGTSQIDWSLSNITVLTTATGNTTLTAINPHSGGTYTIIWVGDGTCRVISFPGNFKGAFQPDCGSGQVSQQDFSYDGSFYYGKVASVPGSANHGFDCPEGSAPAGTPGYDRLYCDSATHRFKTIDNGGAAAQFVKSGADIDVSDNVTNGSHINNSSIPLTGMAAEAPDTVVMNATASSAGPTAVAIPACPSDGVHGLTYVAHVPTCTLITGTGGGGGGSGGGTVVPRTTGCTFNSSCSGANDTGLVFVFNGTTLLATLPPTPPTMPWIIAVCNTNSTNVTIGRNGNTIMGVGLNVDIPPFQCTTIASDTVTGSNYMLSPPVLGGNNCTVVAGSTALTVNCLPNFSDNGTVGAIGANFTVTESTDIPAKIGGLTTVGLGVGVVGWKSNVATQSTSQSTVTLATAPTAGDYELHYSADLHTPCTTGANSVSFAFSWTAASARTLTTGSFILPAAQATSSFMDGIIPLHVASGNVTYTSTISGTCATGTSSYDLNVWLVRVN